MTCLWGAPSGDGLCLSELWLDLKAPVNENAVISRSPLFMRLPMYDVRVFLLRATISVMGTNFAMATAVLNLCADFKHILPASYSLSVEPVPTEAERQTIG